MRVLGFLFPGWWRWWEELVVDLFAHDGIVAQVLGDRHLGLVCVSVDCDFGHSRWVRARGVEALNTYGSLVLESWCDPPCVHCALVAARVDENVVDLLSIDMPSVPLL